MLKSTKVALCGTIALVLVAGCTTKAIPPEPSGSIENQSAEYGAPNVTADTSVRSPVPSPISDPYYTADDTDKTAAAMCEQALDQVARTAQPEAGWAVALQSPDGACSASLGPFARGSEVLMQPDTPFRTASVGKLFTVAATYQLVDEGALKLDTPLQTYVNEDIRKELLDLFGIEHADQVTLAHLLSHTSGLPDFASDPDFVERLLREPGKQWTAAELLDHAVQMGSPVATPGDEFLYSDTGYVLLGRILEAQTGKSLPEIYHERVIDPLALGATYLEGREPDRGTPHAHTYFGDMDLVDLGVMNFDSFGAGGIVSTAEDLVTLSEAMFSGSLLSENARLRMTARPDLGAAMSGSFGHGVELILLGQETCIGHPGYWGSFTFHCPQSNVTLAGTINQSGRSDIGHALMEAALEFARQGSATDGDS